MFTFQDQLSESEDLHPWQKNSQKQLKTGKGKDNSVFLSETGNSPQINRILNQSSSRKIESYQSLSPDSNNQTANLYESHHYEVVFLLFLKQTLILKILRI